MYLKSLVVHGFKSFPDKTIMNFTSGITAIVGPNGSGKSNIVDAIRWVLGEQSSKTLRGAKMEDVIFNGTSKRSPTGFAEVTLVLDNADKALAIEFEEVSVTRKLYRSGESEYLINGKTARLKDIVELFMNTGVGRDGYSVIGQGKISDVLSAKSEDRRQIFEEAAGISKYRYRKIEAERKLESTTENLSRVHDILSEIEERIGPLKIQSEKAKEYLTLRDERKQLEINVWLDSIDKTNDVRADVNEKYEIAKSDLEKAEKQFEDEQSEMDRLSELSNKKYIEIDELTHKIKENEDARGTLVSDRAVALNNIEHAKESIEKITGDVKNGVDHSKEFDEKILLHENSKNQIQEQIDTIKSNLSEIVKKSEEQLKSREGLATRQDTLSAQMTAKTGTLTEIKIKLASLEGEYKNTDEKVAQIDAEIAKKEEELKIHRTELSDANEEYEQAQDVLDSNENTINGYRKKLEVRDAELEKYNAQYSKINSDIVSKTHKRNLLSAMEEQFDGFANSVKTVMQEAKRGRLQNVHGTVSSLISVDDKYALAIETAIGGAIQNIVVDTEQDAKSAIMLLKSENKGRATFLPISSIKGNRLDQNGIERENGYIGIATELLNFEKKYKNIFLNILGRTVVMENIDNAILVAKKYGYRFRIVTLDGQLINAGGSFTGGSQVRGSGVLSRKNEIEELGKELEKLNGSASKLNAKIRELEDETGSIRAGLDGAAAEQNVAKEKLLRAEGIINQYKALIAALNASIDDLSDEKTTVYSNSTNAKKEQQELVAECSKLEKEYTELEKEYDDISASHEQAEQLREKLKNEISQKQLDIVSLEKDIERHCFETEQLKNQKSEFEKELAAKGDEVSAINAQIEAYKTQLDEIENSDKLFTDRIEQFKLAQKKAQDDRNKAEKEIVELRKNSNEAFSLKENLIKEVSRCEAKKASVEAEYDNIINKLWDEYELTLTDSYLLRTSLESVSEANKRIGEIKQRMKTLGNVNIDSIEEYKQVSERYDFLTKQVEDLEHSKQELLNMIENLTNEMKKIFSEQFKVINENFSKVFVELFGGGSAKLELTEPGNVLESGIDIFVTPPGKIIKNLSALSGGEQAFTAVSLYFAIMAVRPAPFCILDEIDAPLDDVNVSRLANYLKKLSDTSQFISITHKRGMMEKADILYGVTMQESGVTKLLTINVSDIEKNFSKFVG